MYGIFCFRFDILANLTKNAKLSWFSDKNGGKPQQSTSLQRGTRKQSPANEGDCFVILPRYDV